MGEQILKETKEKLNSVEVHLKGQLNKVSAGRATINILDDVKVSAYGTFSPINQVATITIVDARQLKIVPFDKSLIKDIDEAITKASLGGSINNDGEMIRFNIPPLTEETRKEKVKEVKKIGENEKIVVRNIRKDANDKIKKADLTQDDIKYFEEQVQIIITSANKNIDDIIANKEKELMTI